MVAQLLRLADFGGALRQPDFEVADPAQRTLRAQSPRRAGLKAAESDKEARETAAGIWKRTNLVNLHENILPTRQRADLILKKVESHQIEEVALRRL